MSEVDAHLDMTVLDELKDIMEDDFDDLLDTFMADSEKRLTEFSEIIKQGDAEQIMRAAHSLKGSCGNVAATALASIFKDLEDMGREDKLDQVEDKYQQARSEYLEVKNCLQGLKN